MEHRLRPHEVQLDLTFAALADANRREIIRLLLHKPRRAGEIAQSLAMSPQALSRHLRLLRQAGLISDEALAADARVRLYGVLPNAFQIIQSWVEQSEDLWRRQLQSFKTFAESQHRAVRGKT